MQFHDYVPAATRWGHIPEVKLLVHRMGGVVHKPASFRESVLKNFEIVAKRHKHIDDFYQTTLELAHECYRESIWVNAERPYYNIWPPVFDLVKNFRIEGVSTKQAFSQLGEEVLLFRFPVGTDIHKLSTLMVCKMSTPEHPELCDIAWWVGGKSLHVKVPVDDRPLDEVFQMPLMDAISESEVKSDDYEGFDDQRWFAVKLLTTVVMLATDARIIQPVVLAKDRHEFEITDDEYVKQLLATRAIKKSGMKGHDIGRDLHEAIERGELPPHYRNAHLCLFWTGAGRTVPKVKLRSGAMVLPHKLREVPTGYLGEEEAVTHGGTDAVPI